MASNSERSLRLKKLSRILPKPTMGPGTAPEDFSQDEEYENEQFDEATAPSEDLRTPAQVAEEEDQRSPAQRHADTRRQDIPGAEMQEAEIAKRNASGELRFTGLEGQPLDEIPYSPDFQAHKMGRVKSALNQRDVDQKAATSSKSKKQPDAARADLINQIKQTFGSKLPPVKVKRKDEE